MKTNTKPHWTFYCFVLKHKLKFITSSLCLTNIVYSTYNYLPNVKIDYSYIHLKLHYVLRLSTKVRCLWLILFVVHINTNQMSKLNNVMEIWSGILIIFRFLYIMKEGSNCSIQIKIYGVWVILASLVDLFE